MDNILRYFEMLRFIPKEPDAISTPDLLKKLQDQGYAIDIRTVQRDLNKLSASGLFPFTSSEDTKPLTWFWPKRVAKLQFPLMTADEALTFKLVEQFLDPLLPLSVKAQLTDYFILADSTLKLSPLADWLNKVRIIPNGQSLLPAQIDSGVLSIVYEALLKNKRFSATYHRRNDDVMQYEINPLGLIFKGGAVYLLATLYDYQDIKQMAMHRFTAAERVDKPITLPTDFSLDSYIRQGGFDYPDNADQNLRLKVKIDASLHKHLSEAKLSQDQQLTPIDDTSYYLQATVQDTRQLRWWLRGFADLVEVLEPTSLREEFAVAARRMNHIYQ